MQNKKNKNQCADCSWRMWTGTGEKVVCFFPTCKRAEYDAVLHKQQARRNEQKNH